MQNVFKVAQFASKIAQVSDEPIIKGIGFLTDIGSDVALYCISQREGSRLESSTLAITNKISQRLKNEDTPNDLNIVNFRKPIIDELLIHALSKCRDEPEEKKNHFTENVFVNILFSKETSLYDDQWGHTAIKDIERFTYNQILLFYWICSGRTIPHSVNEQTYKDYISVFQKPFGIDRDRNALYDGNQQLILNDFYILFDMQYVMGLKHIADLHIKKGNTLHDSYPFFCDAIPSLAKGLRINELFFSDTNVPDCINQDISKLDSIIYRKEKWDIYKEKYL